MSKLQKINFGNRFSTDQKDALLALAKDVNPIVDAVNDLQNNSFSMPYKVYVALLTQTGTSAPIAVILENTLGFVPIFGHQGTGTFSIDNGVEPGSFPYLKTTCFISNRSNSQQFGIQKSLGDNDSIYILSFSQFGTLANSILSNTTIEIRVYN